METKTDSQKLEEGRKFLDNVDTFIFLLQAISFLLFIVSLFLFIWITAATAFKVLLTGILGTAVFSFIRKILKESMKNIVEQVKQKEKSSV